MKRIVIMALDFFEVIDGFEKKGKTDQPAGEKDNCQHKKEFANKTPKQVPDPQTPARSRPMPPVHKNHPVKMEKATPK
jgi:hypothetical protein